MIQNVILSLMFFVLMSPVVCIADFHRNANTIMGPMEMQSRTKDFYWVKFFLNKKVIFETKDFDFGSMDAAYPNWEKAELILIGYSTGNQCAGYNRVIDLRGGKIKISNEFGNCGVLTESSDYPKLNIKNNPIYTSDGDWKIALNGENAPVWYVYRDGVVKEIKKGKELKINTGEEYRYLQKLKIEIPNKKKRDELIKQYGSAKNAYFNLLDAKAKKVGEEVKRLESIDQIGK